MKRPDDHREDIFSIETLTPPTSEEALNSCISNSVYSYSEIDEACDEILEYLNQLEANQPSPSEKETVYLDINKKEDDGVIEEEVKKDSAPKVELKPLPEHLEYQFLGKEEEHEEDSRSIFIDREGSREVPFPTETYDFFFDDFSLRYLFDPMPDEESIQPSGVVDVVHIRVREFDFPTEFVIVEMEEDVKQPLILGRPFLAMSRVHFDMESGDLTFRVHEEELKISVLGAKRRKLEDGGEKSFHFYPP